MRRTIVIPSAVLEAVAIILVNIQMLGGIRTDEAKYALNIPYPHPPLLRWIFDFFSFLPNQEFFLRFLLATLTLQATWFVWDMGKRLPHEHRSLLTGSWILSAAVLLQAGTIMMAPVTAVTGLFFLWLYVRMEERLLGAHFSQVTERLSRKFGFFKSAVHEQEEWIYGLIAFVWLASLFMTYQTAFFLPVIIALYAPSSLSLWKKILYIFAPLVLLTLYTAINPFVIGSFRTGGDTGSHLYILLKVWFIGGSGFATVIGMYGIFTSRKAPLILSFLIFSAYCFFGFQHDYYAIFFTPFFVEGMRRVLLRTKQLPFASLLMLFACTAVLVALFFPPLHPSLARPVMRQINGFTGTGYVMIQGDFGHEWEYESTVPVRRYVPSATSGAKAVVCLEACNPPLPGETWKIMASSGAEVWVKR
jgi:hypothetical protein